MGGGERSGRWKGVRENEMLIKLGQTLPIAGLYVTHRQLFLPSNCVIVSCRLVYLEEPTNSRLQLEQRINAENEAVHIRQMGHSRAELIHLTGKFRIQ